MACAGTSVPQISSDPMVSELVCSRVDRHGCSPTEQLIGAAGPARVVCVPLVVGFAINDVAGDGEVAMYPTVIRGQTGDLPALCSSLALVRPNVSELAVRVLPFALCSERTIGASLDLLVAAAF